MPKRITLFGLPGAGKSTFANQLGQELKLPVHHLDIYFFSENWIEVGDDIFLPRLQNLSNKIVGLLMATAWHRSKRDSNVLIQFSIFVIQRGWQSGEFLKDAGSQIFFKINQRIAHQ